MDSHASTHHDMLIRFPLLCFVFLGFSYPIPARFPSFDSGLFFASFRFAWFLLGNKCSPVSCINKGIFHFLFFFFLLKTPADNRLTTIPMNDPEHISSFVPGAYQELLAMIERGERERDKDGEKKGVDLQLQFPFTLNMNEHKGEDEARNLENYERTKTKS